VHHDGGVITLRDYDPARDAAARAALETAEGPQAAPVEEIIEQDAGDTGELLECRRIAEDGSGLLRAWRQPWLPDGEFCVQVLVAPAARRADHGAELLAAAEE
jgi:hypothetical protein